VAVALGAAEAAPSRLRVLEALRSLLEALTAERGLVLLLDDLHQADRSSWEALNYLARNPPAAAVLIVAAIRPGELFGVPELAALIATLLKDGLVSEVRLPPLDAESVAALARRALPAPQGRRLRPGCTPALVATRSTPSPCWRSWRATRPAGWSPSTCRSGCG
jgi:hypothetical protein